MKNECKISAEELESINDELFNSFDPEQELWIIGGSTKYTYTTPVTYNAGNPDFSADYDIAW